MTRLKRGDYVRIRRAASADEWTLAFVAMASDTDPSSLVLLLDGALRASKGLLVNVAPVTIDYAAETIISLIGDAYEIEVPAEELAVAS